MTYLKYVDKFKNFILELFFPSFCLGCQKEGSLLCQDCKSTLEISEYNYCLCNKNPLRFVGNKSGKCGSCKDKKLSGLYSALPYKEKFLTKKLIYQFKYSPRIKTLAKNLAEVVIEHLALAKNNTEEVWENSVLIPVPLEKSKLKSRGYNQAEELVKELGHILNVPLILGNLIKIKKTLPQMELSKEQREKNLNGAFAIRNSDEIKNKTPVAESAVSLRDKKVFLVDDVYTTGSTMEECAGALRSADAKSVWGIVIAREG